MTNPPASCQSTTSEEFHHWMLETIDRSAAILLISIGHQTGLFQALCDQPPLTPSELAHKTGLNQRYIQEWLNGLSTIGIIDYNPDTHTYYLPAHRGNLLTGAQGQRNLAVTAQYLPMLAEVEQSIINCFHHGGGVGYESYQRFHQVVAEQGAQVFDRALLTHILPLVEGLTEQLTSGINVLDIGCGSAHALNIMATQFPASHFHGIDFSPQAIATGQEEAHQHHNTNLLLTCANLDELHQPNTYDLITAFDTIHDQAHPQTVLANVYQALKPGGTFLMADIQASSHLHNNIGVPLSTYTYTVSTMHCMTVSLALGGQGLGTAWGHEQAHQMLQHAGFHTISLTTIEQDPRNYYYIAHK